MCDARCQCIQCGRQSHNTESTDHNGLHHLSTAMAMPLEEGWGVEGGGGGGGGARGGQEGEGAGGVSGGLTYLLLTCW